MAKNQNDRPKKKKKKKKQRLSKHGKWTDVLHTSLLWNWKHSAIHMPVVDINYIYHILICCKEHYTASGSCFSTQEGQHWRTERQRKCTNPHLLILRHPLPLLPWLRSCLDPLSDVQVLMLNCSLCTWFYLFRQLVDHSAAPPSPPPSPCAFIFYSFFFLNLYIWSYILLVRSNDNSRMLFSVFTVGDWLGTCCTFLELRTYC